MTHARMKIMKNKQLTLGKIKNSYRAVGVRGRGSAVSKYGVGKDGANK